MPGWACPHPRQQADTTPDPRWRLPSPHLPAALRSPWPQKLLTVDLEGEVTMKRSNQKIRHAFLWTAAGATAVAMTAAGVASSALADQHPTAPARAAADPGYPPPRGSYKPLTNCPLPNPIMAAAPPA